MALLNLLKICRNWFEFKDFLNNLYKTRSHFSSALHDMMPLSKNCSKFTLNSAILTPLAPFFCDGSCFHGLSTLTKGIKLQPDPRDSAVSLSGSAKSRRQSSHTFGTGLSPLGLFYCSSALKWDSAAESALKWTAPAFTPGNMRSAELSRTEGSLGLSIWLVAGFIPHLLKLVQQKPFSSLGSEQ